MEQELLIEKPLDQVVMQLRHAPPRRQGLDGVVCSPLEAGKVHGTCGAGLLSP